MDTSNCKRLSCGIVIVNPQRELLLCHVTGHAHWDLPKGCIDDGETPQQAALRETWEETGLQLEPEQLTDLGRFDFRPRKELHLFATMIDRVDPATLSCRSHFIDRATGLRLPEMDGHGWQPFEHAVLLCRPRMATVLQQRVGLGRLHERLSAVRTLAIAA